MAPLQARVDSHAQNQARSARLLEDARQKAKRKTKYDSKATRDKICAEFRARLNNIDPYDWQLNVTEALLLGLDCSVIAGTGAGKTMPFIMPLFAEPNKHVLIISPLNALEEDQAQRFKKMGLSAVAVNGETYNDQLHKDLQSRKYQVILTSPEMCLGYDRFRQVLGDPKLSPHIAAVVIDEAHCISQWGEKFREEYSKLGTLRALVPTHVPVLVTSATLPPLVLAQVRATVHIQSMESYHVDIGIDRPNIAWEVRYMKGGKSDLESLRFLLPRSHGGESDSGTLCQAFVFGEDISDLMAATRWLRENAPPELRDQIACYNSRRTQRAKRIILQLFREGKIKILFTTEAAGMGCDMPHVELVVQFMAPKSLSVWLQRAGRAGRTPSIRARAILLIQPSVFQEKNAKKLKDPDKGDVKEYVKTIDEGLRKWIETTNCRREVADELFDSGTKRRTPLGDCCDICTANAPPTARPVTPPAPRRLSCAYDTWFMYYSRAPYGPPGLLPDDVLHKIASNAQLETIEDLKEVGWSQSCAEKHGAELLQVLAAFDQKFAAERASEKAERAEVKKQETAERRAVQQAARKVEREHQKAIKQSQPKPPRPSRSKNPTPSHHFPIDIHTNSVPPRHPIPLVYQENIPAVHPTVYGSAGSPSPFLFHSGPYINLPNRVPTMLPAHQVPSQSQCNTPFPLSLAVNYAPSFTPPVVHHNHRSQELTSMPQPQSNHDPFIYGPQQPPPRLQPMHDPFVHGQKPLSTSLVTPFRPLPPLHDIREPQRPPSLLPHGPASHEPPHIASFAVSHGYQPNPSHAPFRPPQSHTVPLPATALAQPTADSTRSRDSLPAFRVD